MPVIHKYICIKDLHVVRFHCSYFYFYICASIHIFVFVLITTTYCITSVGLYLKILSEFLWCGCPCLVAYDVLCVLL